METIGNLLNSTSLLETELTGMEISECKLHGPKEWRDGIPGQTGFFGPGYHCGECQRIEADKIKEEEDQRTRVMEEEYRVARIGKLFRECQIGQRFEGISFDEYNAQNDNAERILNKCKSYAEGFYLHVKEGGGLLMVGKPGTGKNHLSAAICNHVMKDSYSTLHTTVMKMIRRVKATWSKTSEETEQKAILSFCQPDLLVIDEVGVQFGSATEQLLLTEIINERYERMRPTIMISNLPTKELSDILGERVIDRFRDGGEVLVFDWDSYRKRK